MLSGALLAVLFAGEFALWFGPVFYEGASPDQVPSFPFVTVLLRGLLLAGIILQLPSRASLRTVAGTGALVGMLVFVPQLPRPFGSAGTPGAAAVIAIYIGWGTATVFIWAAAAIAGWFAAARMSRPTA